MKKWGRAELSNFSHSVTTDTDELISRCALVNVKYYIVVGD